MSPGPRDLYILALGVLVGVILGPAVLGRLAPRQYDHWFVGSGEALNLFNEFNQQAKATALRLQSTGASEASISEEADKIAKGSKGLLDLLLDNRRKHQDRLHAHLVAIILAVVVVMVIETLPAPGNLRARWALSAARYAMLAVWLALILAQPQLLTGLSAVFLALLVVIALLCALVPLPGRTT